MMLCGQGQGHRVSVMFVGGLLLAVTVLHYLLSRDTSHDALFIVSVSCDTSHDALCVQENRERLRPLVRDTVSYLHSVLCSSPAKTIIVEGANATMLDLSLIHI